MHQGQNKRTIAAWGKALMVIGALGALAACETARDQELLDNPNYSQGYADGCQTGHNRVAGFDETVTRDDELALREPAYQIGWRDGHSVCGGDQVDADSASDREIFIHESEHYGSVPR